MSLNMLSFAQPTRYFFTRSKDTHQEKDALFVTLFMRLTREYLKFDDGSKYKKIEPVWFDIEEVKQEQAIEKIKVLPNGIYTYVISEEVFQGLVYLSASCPKELYYVTPIYLAKKFSTFE